MIKAGKLLAVTAVVCFAITSCKKDAVEKGTTNETAVAGDNTVAAAEVHLTEAGTSNESVFKWQMSGTDSTGVAQNVILNQGKVYNASFKLFGKTGNDITSAIAQQSSQYRFYFEPSVNSGIVVIGLNTDQNEMPFGIASKWYTEAASTGKVHVVLKNYHGEAKALSDTVSCTRSATNLDMTFATTIK